MSNLVEKLKARGIKLVEVAGAAGVDKSTVTRWLQHRIPAERVLDVERITGVARHELRPDIYPAPQSDEAA